MVGDGGDGDDGGGDDGGDDGGGGDDDGDDGDVGPPFTHSPPQAPCTSVTSPKWPSDWWQQASIR